MRVGHSMPNQHKRITPAYIHETWSAGIVPYDLLAQTKFWLQKLCDFYFTALKKLIPEYTKLTVFFSTTCT